jgi:tetratricopeptide (TPR) repeat protein
MALADSYSPCPCGSGKKYKWCCQKVESYAERARRLIDNSQHSAALAVLDEGLAKVPDNPWLLERKALCLFVQEKFEESKTCLETLLRSHPDHVGAAILLTRLIMGSEGAVAAAARFQQILGNTKTGARTEFSRIAAALAMTLSKEEVFPAAFKHFELSLLLNDTVSEVVDRSVDSLRANPMVSPWLKQSYDLAEAPDRLSGPRQVQFNQALGWAREGLWSAAATAFELLSSDPVVGAVADRNQGLCRLWLGEEAEAVSSLRRWLARSEATTEAVDLAVVCHLIDETPDREPIELVQLTWPLRDREALLRTLNADPTVAKAPPRPIDPNDEESSEVPSFYLLDRRKLEPRTGLSREEIPLIQGEFLVGAETVVLEFHDDGRLNALIDRVGVLGGGKAIPPAHPKTKVIGQMKAAELAMSWHWYVPSDLPDEEKSRLSKEQIAHVMTQVWPETPMPYLGGRTPQQAARAGNSEIQLRAALLLLEFSAAESEAQIDWGQLRSRLGVPPEPTIDPETVDIESVPLGRLYRVPITRLDDDRLIKLYKRAHEWGVHKVALEAARAIASRPDLSIHDRIDSYELYGELAMDATLRDSAAEARDWIRRGRQAEPFDRRSVTTPLWDMLELHVRTHFDAPELWVPDLAAMLQRYRDDKSAMTIVSSRMIEMGLIRIVASRDDPTGFEYDSRPLQQLLERYGPRVATSSDYLGVSATRGEIWTPEASTQGSAIWTPGSDTVGAVGAEKPRIILPGQ